MGIPAGSPWRVATRHSPWDSPAVSNRNILGKTFYRSKVELRAADWRIDWHGEAAALADSVVLLLAVSIGGAGPVPAGVAAVAAVPAGGDCGGRRAGAGVGDCDAA